MAENAPLIDVSNDEKKILTTLDSFTKLEDGWNSYSVSAHRAV